MPRIRYYFALAKPLLAGFQNRLAVGFQPMANVVDAYNIALPRDLQPCTNGQRIFPYSALSSSKIYSATN
jgi:hypothetical protein